MKVFISWSGDASRKIATELFEWLPMVLQSTQPYMSAESIDKGTRWSSSIANELEGTCVGIVVLCRDNVKAPWINFEAGALAKVVGDAKLAPLLCGLKPSDIGTPLSQFQVTQFNKEDVLRLLKSINSVSEGDALPDSRLEKMHLALWDDLHQKITPLIPSSKDPLEKAPEPESPSQKALEEILVLSRQQSSALSNYETTIGREVQRAFMRFPMREMREDPRFSRRMEERLMMAYRRWSLVHGEILDGIRSKTDPKETESKVEHLGAILSEIMSISMDSLRGSYDNPGRRLRTRVEEGARGLIQPGEPANEESN